MAEAVGLIASAVTLAALFKVCIEAFDVIRTYQTQELELKKLVLRLNVEKCRLYVWGQAMGLSRPSRRKPLDECPFQATVKESLDFILEVFNDSHKIKDKYGCKEFARSMQIDNEGSEMIKKFSAPFKNFKIRGAMRGKQPDMLKKAQWVVHDRKKFQLLIQEVKELIDGLQDITKGLSSIDRQDEVIYTRVMSIRDVDTLALVADVCEDDHPRIAYAASTRADSISMASTKRHNIAAWRSAIESEDSDTTSIASLENLTVTELKHQISRLLRDREEREARRAMAVPAAGSEQPTEQDENELQKNTIAGLERERDFYFGKLRDIEIYIFDSVSKDPGLEQADDGWVKTVQGFLYKIEEGFEPPKDPDAKDDVAAVQSKEEGSESSAALGTEDDNAASLSTKEESDLPVDTAATNTETPTQQTDELQTPTEAEGKNADPSIQVVP